MKRFATILETVPQPCRIFGTALRPFSLGHHLLFHRLNLPFVNNAKADCSVEQFLNAVVLCANSYEGNIAGFESGDWAIAAEKWIGAIKKKKPDMKAALLLFRKHLEDGYRMAPVWRHGNVSGATITLSAPWEQLLKCRLVMAGFSASEVLNGYLPALWYDYYTASEIKQLETCDKPGNWKSVFYTVEDALREEEAEKATPTEGAP